MKIVVLDSYTAVSTDLSLDGLSEFSDDITIYNRTKPVDTASRIGDADIVITNKTVLSKEIMEQCPKLKYIGLFSTGYNVIDIDFCKKRGIVVSNVPNYSTNAVAQLTFAFILHFYSLVDKHNHEVHHGKWADCPDFSFYDPRIQELSGKTIGLIGFGSIGKKVSKIAQAFDMNVLVFSRTKYPEYENDNLKFVSLDEMLENSDIVSIHCPLFEETKELINQETIKKMKNSAILINTARGAIINEQAVADALNSNKLYGACVDVTTVEPIDPNNPLLTAKNCIITPHIAWACKETRARLIDVVCDNIRAFLNRNPKNNVAQ